MHSEQAVIATKCVEFGFRNPALQRERCIKCKGRMAFGENKSVTVRVIRARNAQNSLVKCAEDIYN
jgi:hypothetical protein